MVSAAWQIYAELPSTPGHAVRAAYATRVIAGSVNPGSQAIIAACNAVLTQPSSPPGTGIVDIADPVVIPGNNIPDNLIQVAVNGLWSVLAGA